MDSELVSNRESELAEDGGLSRPSSAFAYTPQFEKLCPYYMAIGLSYEDYWYGDAAKAKYAREAFKYKQRFDNQNMWLQGLYVYEAICCTSPILRAFSKAKKPVDYRAEPYDLFPNRSAKSREKQEKSYRKAKASMEMFMVGINKKFEKKGEEDAG